MTGTIEKRKARSRAALWVLEAVLLAAVPGTAQKQPNFSGAWNLNLDNSELGPMPRPDSAHYVIRHSGANLSLDYTQDEKKTHADLITDGDERVTDSNPDTEIWTRVYWAGPVLVFESRQKARPAHASEGLKWTSRWSLSEDGKTLAIQKHFTTRDGEFDQKLLFDKQ